MNLKESSASVVPIYHLSDYKDSFQEVLFFGRNPGKIINGQYYDEPCKYILLPHKDYYQGTNNFSNPPKFDTSTEYSAYGVMFNLFNSRIIPVDVDSTTLPEIVELTKKIIQEDIVEVVDLVQSSPNSLVNWHLWVGLKEYRNIRHLLGLIPYICKGYIRCCDDRKEATLRVSKKFSIINRPHIPPLNFMTFKKDGEDIMIYQKFTFPDGLEPKKKSINLRS